MALILAGPLAFAGVCDSDSGVAAGDLAVVCNDWGWFVAFAVVWAWGLAWGLTFALAGFGAWGFAVAWAVAWAGAGTGAEDWDWDWTGAGAYFGTKLWISIVSYLWAIRHPENNIRWLSWLMAILSFLLGGFCFYQANQNGEDILPGVILGTAVMGIIALVVGTLVGAGKRLQASGFGYGARWFWLAVPAVLGVVAGWHSYGAFPWAG